MSVSDSAWTHYCPDCHEEVTEDMERETPHGVMHVCIGCGLWIEEGDTILELGTFVGLDFADLRERLSALIDRGFDPCLIPGAADDILAGGDGERNREAWEEIAAFLDEHEADVEADESPEVVQ